MNRPENWPELLDRHLNEWAYVCFEYGTADCVSFVSAWMKRIGYVEPLEGIPKWSTALGAARAFQSLGGFETAIDGRMIELGCSRVAVGLAKRGDVVLVRATTRTRAVGICNGSTVSVLTPNGLTNITLIQNAMIAWSI